MAERRIISRRLLEEIELQFESVDGFKKLVANYARGLFGQGWVWVVAYDGQLEILATGPGESFLTRADSDKIVPIFALDAWEHAYFTQFDQDFDAYVNAWWACQDMVVAEEYFVHALESSGRDA
jgi:Fe-Mn family superoxide dismutase